MTNLDQRFEDKVQEIFDTLVERNPGFATHLGIHKYDDKLTDMSRGKILEDISLTKKWLEEFKQFDRKKLSEEQKIDLDALIYTLELDLYQVEEIRNWERNPYLVIGFFDHIEPLLRRESAPLNERIGFIIERIRKAPEFLGQLRTLVSGEPEGLWSEMALEVCREIPRFLGLILKTASESKKVNRPTLKSLTEAIQKAEKEVKRHHRWIEEELKPKCVDEWAIGREKFEGLLEKRLLGMSSERILALGERLLKEKKEELEQIAWKILKEEGIEPEENVVELSKEIVQKDHPKNFAEALGAYRTSIKEARQFVIEHNLATLPEGESLTVVETPAYLRPTTPLAAYIEPGRFEEKQEGFYLVTPQEDMSQFNYPNIRNTTVHEGYPGHHLQLACANRNPRLARVLLHPIETIEGWAHYCEELMKEHGFTNSPKEKFVQINDEIWRAARIILDVRMHRGEMKMEEATDFLMKEVGMNRYVAENEVKRYTLTPSYQLSYLLGKILIKELKKKVKKTKGEKFSEKGFHDCLLYGGSLPLKLMERELKLAFS
jgi:uncharacterized protein (DUF885 family)